MKHLHNLLIPILAGTIVIMLLLWPPSPTKANVMPVGDEVTLTDSAYFEADSVYSDYKASDFKQNYAIDLKPDGYLILDEDSNVYYVPFKNLEVWFLEMNM